MKEPGMYGLLALAFAQMGKGQIPQATETYQALGKIDAPGRSLMTSGLSSPAIYEGRFSQAAQMLTQGAAADLATKDPETGCGEACRP